MSLPAPEVRPASMTPPPAPAGDRPLLQVEDLRTYFDTPRGVVKAVDGVSFDLEQGHTVGIVGESGSGKTVLSRSIMHLLGRAAITDGGSVRFDGREIRAMSDDEIRRIWGMEMAIVFQDPMTSLNPVVKIGRQITEPIRKHLGVSKREAEELAVSLMRSVGIPAPEKRMTEYPHRLSGGMRQRVTIAIALSCGPKLMIADEPTTALDVTVQKQILNLLQQVQRERNMAMILITHDLGVVANYADEIIVMYAGQIVEKAPTRTIFSAMHHPYTEALMASIPRISNPSHTLLHAIPGRPPDLANLPRGCRFARRCRYAQHECLDADLELTPAETPGHTYRCLFPVGTPAGREALARNEAAGVNALGTSVDVTVAVETEPVGEV